MKLFKPALILLFSVALLSCSVQKRNFRGGYYVAWHGAAPRAKEAKQTPKVPEVMNVRPSRVNTTQPQFSASLRSQPSQPVFTGTRTYLDNCDTIYFRKGEMKAARVLEINPTEIKYKNCGNEDGPLIIVNKDDVGYIKYANGVVEEFKREATVPGTKTMEQRMNESNIAYNSKMSVWMAAIGIPALFLGGLGMIFLCMGIKAGHRARRGINKDPKRLARYSRMANAGFLTNLIAYLLVGVLFSLFVLYMVGTVYALIIGGILLLGLYWAIGF